MNHSDDINELASALAKAQGQITTAAKDKTNPFLKSSYADLASVMAAARGPLSANGLAVIQTAETADDGSVSVSTMLAHASGQWIAGTMSMVAGDERGKSSAQVLGSIVTYLRRYGYMAITGVVADDDDDGNGATGHAPAPKIAPKAETPKPSDTVAASAPLTENIPGTHWIDDDTTRKRFWGYTRDTLGLSDKEVYAALGVEKIHGYAGDKAAAMAAIQAYVRREAGIARVENIARGLGIDLDEQDHAEVEQLAASVGGTVAA